MEQSGAVTSGAAPAVVHLCLPAAGLVGLLELLRPAPRLEPALRALLSRHGAAARCSSDTETHT